MAEVSAHISHAAPTAQTLNLLELSHVPAFRHRLSPVLILMNLGTLIYKAKPGKNEYQQLGIARDSQGLVGKQRYISHFVVYTRQQARTFAFVWGRT